MTDNCFNALVALATGESVLEISRRGFHDAMPVVVRFDPEPTLSTWSNPTVRRSAASDCRDLDLVDLGELGIDWDDVLDGFREDPAGGCRRRARAGSSLHRRRKLVRQAGGAR